MSFKYSREAQCEERWNLLLIDKNFVKTAPTVYVIVALSKCVNFTEILRINGESEFPKFPHCVKVVCQNPKKSKTICCEYQKRDRHAEN